MTVTAPNSTAQSEASHGGANPDLPGSGSGPHVGTGSSPAAKESYLGGLLSALTGRPGHVQGGEPIAKEALEAETRRLFDEVHLVANERPELARDLNLIIDQVG